MTALYYELDWYSVLLAVVLGAIWWWYLRQPRNLPPGPVGLPYLGSLLEIVENGNKDYPKYVDGLHLKYGPVISVRAGSQLFIMISDGKLLAELFSTKEFSNRPVKNFSILDKMSRGGSCGVTFGNGDPHREMRRFVLMSLRDLGVGRHSIDEIIQTEASILSQYLEENSRENDGVVLDMKIKFENASANIIHHIAFGFRYEYDDPKWRPIVKSLYDIFATNAQAIPENFIPIISKLPNWLKARLTGDVETRFLELNQHVEDYIQSQIDSHRATYCAEEIRDFIDLYIKYENEKREHYTRDNIFVTIRDLFMAGADTTATLLTWAVSYLVKYPEVQQQVQEEIDEVIGGRTFQRQDREKLIKTRAFINETLRCASVASFTTPHTVTRPTTVSGYTIPASSVIQASQYTLHHNKSYWVDPSKFKIERWINNQGELLTHEEHFSPFSSGERSCVGKQLANIEIIVFFVEILQKFRVEAAPGYPEVTGNQKPGGLIRAPQDFHFRAIQRHV